MLTVLTANHSQLCTLLVDFPTNVFFKISRAPSIRLPSFHRRPRLRHQHRSWPDDIKKRREQWQTGEGMDPWKDLQGKWREGEKEQAQNLMLSWQDAKQRQTKQRVGFLLVARTITTKTLPIMAWIQFRTSTGKNPW